MKRLLIRFLEIALFRKGPRDLPSSPLLLGLVVILNLLVSWLLLGLDLDGAMALLESVTGLLLMVGFIGGALAVCRKRPRFLQTASAALGCDGLIAGFAWLLLAGTRLFPEAATLAGLPLLLLMVWQVAVMGHILGQALSAGYWTGMALSLAYTVISIQIMMKLFPVAA